MTQRPPAEASISAFVQAQTSARLKKLAKELRAAARKPEDADAIHDLRVAIRRLTECIRLFDHFFEGNSKKIRKRLRRLMDFCGDVRNCDIALQFLAGIGAVDPDAAPYLASKRLGYQKVLKRSLKKWKKRAYTDAWTADLKVDKSAKSDLWDLKENSSHNAQLVLPGLVAEFFSAGAAATIPGVDYRSIHKFRILGKHLRYTFELFEPVYGARLQKILSEMKMLQDQLGDINDCVTAMELLSGYKQTKASIQKLLESREAGFRAFWTRSFGPEKEGQWQLMLGHPETAGERSGPASKSKRPTSKHTTSKHTTSKHPTSKRSASKRKQSARK